MTPIKNGVLQKWHTLRKCYPVYQGLSWLICKRKLLNLLYDSDSWSWDFKVEIFLLQNDISGTLLCLIVVGFGSISRVLVVLEKTNKEVVRCHLCWLPFLVGDIFDERSALFVSNTLSMGAIAPLLDISSYVTLAKSCSVICRIWRTCRRRRLLEDYV